MHAGRIGLLLAVLLVLGACATSPYGKDMASLAPKAESQILLTVKSARVTRLDGEPVDNSQEHIPIAPGLRQVSVIKDNCFIPLVILCVFLFDSYEMQFQAQGGHAYEITLAGDIFDLTSRQTVARKPEKTPSPEQADQPMTETREAQHRDEP